MMKYALYFLLVHSYYLKTLLNSIHININIQTDTINESYNEITPIVILKDLSGLCCFVQVTRLAST